MRAWASAMAACRANSSSSSASSAPNTRRSSRLNTMQAPMMRAAPLQRHADHPAQRGALGWATCPPGTWSYRRTRPAPGARRRRRSSPRSAGTPARTGRPRRCRLPCGRCRPPRRRCTPSPRPRAAGRWRGPGSAPAAPAGTARRPGPRRPRSARPPARTGRPGGRARRQLDLRAPGSPYARGRGSAVTGSAPRQVTPRAEHLPRAGRRQGARFARESDVDVARLRGRPRAWSEWSLARASRTCLERR